MNEQLPLGLQLRASARFANFVSAGQTELLGQLQRMAAGGPPYQLYCWGAAGCGKTHLLQACCRNADDAGRSAAYLPLRDHTQLSPEVLHAWESFQLVCLDDIDAVAGDEDWEEALFHFYNRLVDSANQLLVSAAVAPSGLAIRLPDLASRLGAGLVYQLHALNDEQRLDAMRMRARERGIELPEETGRYLLRHMPRDLSVLLTLLDRLDTASLAAQRKLTVPFVKSVLEL
jgi:DnaA family protein